MERDLQTTAVKHAIQESGVHVRYLVPVGHPKPDQKTCGAKGLGELIRSRWAKKPTAAVASWAKRLMSQVSYHGPSAPLNLLSCVCCKVSPLARKVGIPVCFHAQEGRKRQPVFGCLSFFFCVIGRITHTVLFLRSQRWGDGLSEGLPGPAWFLTGAAFTLGLRATTKRLT